MARVADEADPQERNRSGWEIRAAQNSEIDQLARLWYDAWQDAHATILPADLVRLRTLESFRERIARGLSDVRVAGPLGGALGLCVVKGDELYQLFVAAEGRGSGVAAALIADAEATLAARGIRSAWLSCAIGNERAARFYEKQGWRRAGTMIGRLETSEGEYMLESWRYEKTLS